MVENLKSQKYELKRPDNGEKYKYHMIKHAHEKSNPKNRDRLEILKHWKKNACKDGLNVSIVLSVMYHHQAQYRRLLKFFQNLNYTLVKKNFKRFYVNITVDLQ